VILTKPFDCNEGGHTVILEVATLAVQPGEESRFESAFRDAARYIAAAPGYVEHELQHCVETPGKYVLLVRWQSVEDHTVRFKGSAGYQLFRAVIHPFYAEPPRAEHFERVADRE
jgi:heme-degrading monooxygenase HmoA